VIGCPVTLRGRVFPSARAAAQEAGVHANTIYRHLRRHGTLDGLHRPSSDRTPRTVVIDGAEHPSIHAAARALGVSRGTIRRRMA
jgi:transcriptional regulator of acetoin/glycerol metabolism